MKKLPLLAALGMLVLSLMLATTQAMAGPAAAGSHTPKPFLTGTPGTPPPGPPANPGNAQNNTPGAQATAQAGLHGQPSIYRGTIAQVSATSLTLTLADGSTVTMGMTPDTKIRVPGPKSQGDTLVIGMHVMAMAFTDQNNNLVARSVIVIPGQPLRVHRVGVVTSYTAGASITIKATDGNLYTFSLGTDTKILPDGSTVTVGARVTIIAPRDPASVIVAATGIVVQGGQ